MAQLSYYWGGTITGDATEAPYSDDEFSDIWRKMFQRDRTYQGVIGGALNELAVSNPAGVTARVASGRALVDGKFYENDANVDFAAGVAGSYSIVLRKTWATQEVRLALIGPGGPAPTQNDGVVWEIVLYDLVSTGAAISSLIDRRRYILRGPSRRILIPASFNLDVAGGVIGDPRSKGWELIDGAFTSAYGFFFVPNDYYANMTIRPLLFSNSIGDIAVSEWAIEYGPYDMALCNSATWGDFTNINDDVSIFTFTIVNTVQCGSILNLGTLDLIRPNDYMRLSFIRDGANVNDDLGDVCYIPGWMMEYDSIT